MTRECGGSTVEFRFYRSGVSQVYLVGSFDGWNLSNHPMEMESDGEWVIHLDLPPGSHQFRYLADGQWFTDFAAFGVEPGPYGWNSVIHVSPPLELPAVTRSSSDRRVA